MIVRSFAVAILFLLTAGFASASADRTIAQFHHTKWTAKDGAPSQISALAQTRDGYLWIGSAVGLFRFDGVRFERYQPQRGVALPAHNIYSLLATPDGGLWISFRPSGLGYVDARGRISVFTRPEELPASQVYEMAMDHDGRLWAATHEGLALRTGTRWTTVGNEWNFSSERIWDLAVDPDGTLWVVTDTTIVLLRRGRRRFEPTGARFRYPGRVLVGSSGEVWMAEELQFVQQLSGPARGSRFDLPGFHFLAARDGSMWAADVSKGLLRKRSRSVPASPVDSFRAADGLTSDVPQCMLEDREGNIWVGTAKGLDRFRYSHVVPVSLPPAHQKLTLVAVENGDLLAGSAADRRTIRLRGEGFSVIDAPGQTSSTYRDRSGRVWWGGYGGIWRQRDGTMQHFPIPALPPDYVWEVVRADDGGLWAGYGDVGLLHFDGARWTNRAPPAGLLKRVPSATFHDARGRIWFGYTENRIAVLERGRVTHYSSGNGIDVGRIRVIRGRGPNYWIGGELGLAVFANGAFRSVVTSNGERFGTVSGIIATADGTVWLNEMRGIIRIPAEEARQAAANPRHRVHFQLFDFLDGLPGLPQMNWTVSTAVEAADGRLWFATDNGLARIDPHLLRTNAIPPSVVIRSIVADREYSPVEPIRLPVNTDHLQIHYTALSLSMPERVKFRHKLEGVDAGWQDAGTRREAFYTNIRPGKYRFRVIASNNDGVWNESGTSIAFDVPPAFYQTRWFAALCSAMLAGALWAAYRARVRHVQARMQRLHDERLDERMRIARELHDTLLQGFLSASMQLHVAAERLTDDSPAKPIVTNVLKLVSTVSEEGRLAVRGLRNSESSEPLEQAFSRAGVELAQPQDAGFRVIVTGTARPLPGLIRDEIYRIGREALANSFHHSSARNIEVELEYRDDALVLRIRDDGRGMGEDTLHSGRGDHWGLAGMRERADRIEARLRVSSREGAGTEVELEVPRSIAYQMPASHGRLLSFWRFLTGRQSRASFSG